MVTDVEFPVFVGGFLAAVPGILSGIGAIAGPIANYFSGRKAQKETNQLAISESQKQMDFQERMSNTAVQRQMKDLQAAGLNPALAASYGGASSPAGAMATGLSSPHGAGVESAKSMRSHMQEIRNLRGQRVLMDAQVDAANAAAENSRASATSTREQIPYVLDNLAAQNESLMSSAAQSRASAANLSSQTLLNQAALGPRRAISDMVGGISPLIQNSARGIRLLNDALFSPQSNVQRIVGRAADAFYNNSSRRSR